MLGAGGATAAPSEEPSCAYIEAGAPGPADNRLDVAPGEYANIEIERVRELIRVNETDYGGYHREVDCSGGQATVHNIDSIVVSLFEPSRAEEDFFEGTLALDMQDGLFAPGATPEAGGDSEIELTTDGSVPFLTDFSMITSRGEDQIRSSTSSAATQVNLNAAETVPDMDITTPPVLFSAMYTGSGDDVVVDKNSLKFGKGGGFPGLGLAVLSEKGNDTVKASFAFGGQGNDNLVGGKNVDLLIGGEGDDALRGKNGTDFLVADGGHDLMLGGHGADLLLGFDGNGDRVHCDEGRDRAIIDFGDKRQSCETVRERRFSEDGDGGDGSFLPFKVRTRDRHGKPLL